jgi:HEAT repeat protein
MEKTETTLARQHFFTHRTGYAADLGKEENRLSRGRRRLPARLVPSCAQWSHIMRSVRLFLALVLPAAIVLPVQAGFIFGRHAKVNPAQRVPELVVVVKTDQNESKRESAARELRDYDPAANPDIVPVLIDVLQHDKSAGVRAEAAQSLGKLRPVTQIAGMALEDALKDPSLRVRLQARTSLVSYRLSGFRSDAQMAEAPAPPPAANTPPKTNLLSRSLLPRITPAPVPTRISGETAPPPLAQPSLAQPPLAQPLVPTAAPATPAAPKPVIPSNDAGPDLAPDKK